MKRKFSTWAKTRITGYTIFAVGSLVLVYAKSNGWIAGTDEIELWLGVGGVFGVTAAVNVKADKVEDVDGQHEAAV
jgi:hypothetical protein